MRNTRRDAALPRRNPRSSSGESRRIRRYRTPKGLSCRTLGAQRLGSVTLEVRALAGQRRRRGDVGPGPGLRGTQLRWLTQRTSVENHVHPDRRTSIHLTATRTCHRSWAWSMGRPSVATAAVVVSPIRIKRVLIGLADERDRREIPYFAAAGALVPSDHR